MRHPILWLTLFVVLLAARPLAVHAAPVDAYPADPPGSRVMDRASILIGDSETARVYAVLYRLKDLWRVDVFRGQLSEAGVTWKKLYAWKLIFQGQKYPVAPVTVLEISKDADKVQFYLSEVFKYHEARVSLYLNWDQKTGKFREGFSD